MCALIVAVAMVSVGVTLAEGEPNFETNVVVIGEIEIELIDEYYEKQPGFDPDDTPGTGKHYTRENPPIVTPGEPVTKIISVKNTGKHDCYVRLLILKEWQVNGESYAGKIQLNHTAQQEAYWYQGAPVQVGTDWYDCYYYKDILPVGSRATQNLCDSFTLTGVTVDEVAGITGDIKVFAQAVQSDYVDIAELTNANEYQINNCSATIVKNNGMIVKWKDSLIFN